MRPAAAAALGTLGGRRPPRRGPQPSPHRGCLQGVDGGTQSPRDGPRRGWSPGPVGVQVRHRGLGSACLRMASSPRRLFPRSSKTVSRKLRLEGPKSGERKTLSFPVLILNPKEGSARPSWVAQPAPGPVMGLRSDTLTLQPGSRGTPWQGAQSSLIRSSTQSRGAREGHTCHTCSLGQGCSLWATSAPSGHATSPKPLCTSAAHLLLSCTSCEVCLGLERSGRTRGCVFGVGEK